MNNKYNDLFDELVKSYYNGNFDETLKRIMVCHKKSPQETFEIIRSLCGVDMEFDNNYVYNLKKAITEYTVNTRLIEKLKGCNESCPRNEDGKFSCQVACPFDAILYDEEERSTYIDNDKCLNCGVCVDSCKHGLILDKVYFLPVLDLMQNNKKVFAAVAPAISGQFGAEVTMDQIRAALIKIGFTDMIEVAFAADVLTIKEAVEFDKHVNGPKDLMITSCCCPIWIGILRKVYKELVPDLSPSVSPMVAAARMIKSLDSDAKVVFIGPCIAKKAEAKDKDLNDAVDFVLTFQELDEVFRTLDIKPGDLDGVPSVEYASRGGRLYARSGGVSIAVSETVEELFPEKHKYFKAAKASGVKDCKELLENALNRNVDANFLEGMGCVGGCVGGPKAIIPTEQGKESADKFAYDSPIKVPVHSKVLDEVLNKLGINSIDDFHDHEKVSIFEREF
ncbi:iron hydrogenase [Clostridium beijerinckii]|jgi:Iron only hydrogenase large subunit, C-terminal domain|uniref:4Fe-4S dicluster domain-containing protein n=2 Tax=Clostridium beijerinckii TaxID=1520 RepID=A0AB74VL74_CLOBE|nr:[Fe-Fe] hydrogenase large subunit C-terminal domain-containing protein [Clostridium beijerinckii]NRZ26363.1 iron only hydrogenase large subunit-like protein [Clostridium beijerinckii]NYB98876.1 iron only hydrogenase large subunit-like protein [Clostridium beijerinckii]OOM21126.1 iron hydrogenase 1 [Clostridium beijerinckii]QUN37065.1 4Fe-4S dicluster domain-containing protein [Clostridium beijerinckii]UBT23883.1 [FeFe] hydrogenase [Clostridium beijerinckii]